MSWELYNPGVTLLFEQNPQNQKGNARNPFLKQLRTRRNRSLMRTRMRKRRMSPQAPRRGLPADRRLRGNGRRLPSNFGLHGTLFRTHSCLGRSCFFSFYLQQRAHALSPLDISGLGEPVFCLRPLWKITSESLLGCRYPFGGTCSVPLPMC